MPKFERPSAEAIALVRDDLRRNPEKNVLALWLALANETDAFDGVAREDQGFLLGYALAVLDAEKSAQSTTLVSAPPSSVEAPDDPPLAVSVSAAVVKWLESCVQNYHAVSMGHAELRIRAYEFGTEDDGRVSFEVDVESRTTESFSGPVK